MLITKVRPLHDSFPQNSQRCEPGWRKKYSKTL